MKPGAASLKLRLLLIVGFAMVPFAFLLGLNAFSTFRRDQAAAEQNMSRFAHFISSNTSQMLEASRQFLDAAIAMYANSPGDMCPVFLEAMELQSAFIDRFSLFSPEGQLLYASGTPPFPAHSIDARLLARAVHAGRPVIEMLADGTADSRQRLCAVYSPRSGKGNTRLTGYAVLNLDWLNYFLGKHPDKQQPSFLPRDTVLTILTDKGVVLTRFPDTMEWVGRAVPDTPIFRAIRARGEGTIRTEGLDGVRRYYAFRPVDGTMNSLYVNVGVSERTMLAPGIRELTRNLAGLLAIGLVAYTLLWIGAQRLITQPVTTLLSATRRIENGDLKARVNPDRGPLEIREWAGAFNRMAAALDKNETERARTHAMLVESDNSLREMTLRLALAEERQRRRIAAGLHDNVGPLLASCYMKLGVALKNVNNAGGATLIEESRRLLDEALRRSQALVYDLSSPTLHTLGLAPALEELCQDTETQHRLRVSFRSVNVQAGLPGDRGVILYQAARELLNNVVKHAGASRAEVSCNSDGFAISLCVADDGVGITTPDAATGFSREGGFGLFNLREILTHMGGSLKVESEPGRGTRVTVTLPLPAHDEGEVKTS